ncbi:MAG: 3-hydroxyacyl-CoA dehydrogenase/enoyl-CoA hydratase family protein [Thermoplasmata archaeon]
MKNVIVIGAGTMGAGIATVCAINGHKVFLIDINQDILNKSIERIKWSLESLHRKGRLKLSPDIIMNSIKTETSIENIQEHIDIVIEAVVEKSSVKKELFKILDERFDSILATNTSSIPIDEIARDLKGRKRIIGMHFFNPPTLINLVEIIPGEYTSTETIEKAMEFSRSLGMETILVKRDIPGFVVNRINLRIFDTVLTMAENGVDIEDIDSVARYRLMLPMGFFELFDFIGIDVLYNVINELNSRGFGIGDHRILREKIERGKIGMKVGEGFYRYGKSYARAVIRKRDVYGIDPLRIISVGINEASWIIRNGIASVEDVDRGQRIGMGYAAGLLEMADGYGIDNVNLILKSMNIKPDPLLEKMLDEGRFGIKNGYGFYRWPYRKVDLQGLIYERRWNHAFITFNRPERMNSLDLKAWDSIKIALSMADEDDVRCIFFSGKGRAFCTGDDIKEMYSWKNREESMSFFSHVEDAFRSLAKSDKILIALVDGYAYGGGAEMLLLFDYVISSSASEISFSEVKIGAIPPVATTLGIDMLGRKILRYAIFGDPMNAEEARGIGLVDTVVPEGQIERIYYEISRSIEDLDKNALKSIKKIVNVKKLSDDLRYSLNELIDLSTRESFKEGMRKFLER